MELYPGTEINPIIYRLMDIAHKELENRLSENKYTDDWQWNNTCFQFIVCKSVGFKYGRPVEEYSDPYRFCYKADEEWYGTAEEQLNDWFDRWF